MSSRCGCGYLDIFSRLSFLFFHPLSGSIETLKLSQKAVKSKQPNNHLYFILSSEIMTNIRVIKVVSIYSDLLCCCVVVLRPR